MEKIPTDKSDFEIVRTTIASKSRKLNAKWTLAPLDFDIYETVELTEEEKEGMSVEQQEVWKALKAEKKVDLESELMAVMAFQIAKEMDNEILSSIQNGTTTKF